MRAIILENKIIGNSSLLKTQRDKYYKMRFSCDGFSDASPGQFVMIKVNNSYDPFLRRPMSIYKIDKKRGGFEILYQVVGKGTNIMSELKKGDEVDVLGPLGRGFWIPEKIERAIIVAGGIGVAPMVALAEKIIKKGQGVKESSENKNPILEPSNPRTLEPFQYEIDWDKLKDITWKSVHFLDNVIDMNRYPLKKIEMMTKANRKIGLGVMGFADMLIEMGVSYNSNRAIQLAEEVMSFIDRESKMASADLAKTRGTFPNFKGSRWDEDFENNGNNYPYKGLKIRNATTTTIAPTGTISIIAGCSSGVEPLFAVSYIRTVMDKDELVEVHPYFERVAKERGFYSERLMKEIAKKGHICDMPDIPEDICKIFVTSHNIAPDWHIKMQAVFQKYTDNAVSKTVNFKFAATQDDVKKAYVLAYKLGCKGVTIYRDGSRDEQVLSTGDTKKKEQKVSNNGHEKIVPRPRPEITRGTTHRVGTGCGNLYVTINVCDEGKPFEIFTRMGKAGGCAASQSEAIGRLVSLSLRSGIEPDEIVKQLMGISCHMPAWENGNRVLSCSDAISKAIGRYLSEVGAVKPANQTQSFEISVGACPDCGSSMEQADGCLVCRACGYSKCS